MSDDFDGSKLMAGTSEEREISIRPRHVALSENGSDSTSPMWMVNSSSSKKEEVDYRY